MRLFVGLASERRRRRESAVVIGRAGPGPGNAVYIGRLPRIARGSGDGEQQLMAAGRPRSGAGAETTDRTGPGRVGVGVGRSSGSSARSEPAGGLGA